MYWFQLSQCDQSLAAEWLNAIEVAAKPPAELGEKYAQSVLGFVGVTRYFANPLAAMEDLRTALRWFMAAARHEGADIMIEQVVHWYRYGNANGFRDADVDAFLADPEIRERYRQCFPRTA